MVDIEYSDYLKRFNQIRQKNTSYVVLFSEDDGKCVYSIRDLDMPLSDSAVSFESLIELDNFLYRLIGISVLSELTM